MRKNELLNSIKSLNLRTGDKVKITLTEEGKENCMLYRLNIKNNVDIQHQELVFDGAFFSNIYFDRYGKQKKSSTIGGTTLRLCRIYVKGGKGKLNFTDFLDATDIEKIECLTNTNRRRKNNWLNIEEY